MYRQPWFLLSLAMFFSTHDANADTTQRVSMGADLYALYEKSTDNPITMLDQKEGVTLVDISIDDLPAILDLAHDRLGRCGGLMMESKATTSLDFLDQISVQASAPSHYASLYDLSEGETVALGMEAINPAEIFETIAELTRYPNRFYSTSHGEASQIELHKKWQSLTSHLPYISVRLFTHNGWRQPSVILTIKGASLPEEFIILGAHGDSKARGFGNDFLAPGADDDASGVAAITEVIRALATIEFRPTRTIEFISYAAEEVGLLGSSDIAKQYRASNRNVIGVFQLDMVNYRGSSYDMVLMSDHTSPPQNRFVESLLATYLPSLNFTYDRCGYACSDHASWTRQGYAASIPFEATLNTKNSHIHTTRDTLEHSNPDPESAAQFARLALAYAIELAQ